MRKIFGVTAVAIAVVACGGTDEVQETEEVAEITSELRRPQFCGGIAAIRCPSGRVCVDDPTDSCDPSKGGADCGGICVRTMPCFPELKYVSRDPRQCAAMLFICEQGRQPFFNASGCGCACSI
jgi:hypothetical protein